MEAAKTRSAIRRLTLGLARQRLRETPAGILPDVEAVFAPVLAMFLDRTTAVDVGAWHGDFSAALASSGLDVWAFEASPSQGLHLKKRFLAWPNVRVYNCALMDFDGTAPLYLAEMEGWHVAEDATPFSAMAPHPAPDILDFTQGLPVAVRRLSSLQEAGLVPSSIGFLKIDVEGSERRVLTGVGDLTAEMVMLEFWAPDHPFNQGHTRNNPLDHLAFMAAKGYRDALVFTRNASSSDYTVRMNSFAPEQGSWGNMVFFRDPCVAEMAAEASLEVFGPERMGG